MTTEVAKLEVDEAMAQAQVEALNLPLFKGHPKQAEYRQPLLVELDGLLQQKERFTTKQKDFYDLYQWSKSIVKVCEWQKLLPKTYAHLLH